MNERIQELAKEHLRHEMYAAYGEIVEGDYYEFDPKELQNFVESIVRECSEIAAQQGRVGWNDDRKAQARVDSELIKNHFGITG
jgi:hypothetical protein